MNKLRETNELIDGIREMEELGIKMDKLIFLADIAKSLAIIADCLSDKNFRESN